MRKLKKIYIIYISNNRSIDISIDISNICHLSICFLKKILKGYPKRISDAVKAEKKTDDNDDDDNNNDNIVKLTVMAIDHMLALAITAIFLCSTCSDLKKKTNDDRKSFTSLSYIYETFTPRIHHSLSLSLSLS